MTEASHPDGSDAAASLVRADRRAPDELRTVTIERGWSAHAEGSDRNDGQGESPRPGKGAERTAQVLAEGVYIHTGQS